MRRYALLALVAVPAWLGCSTAAPTSSVAEPTAEGQQKIFYGKPDNTHGAVVAILSSNLANGKQGWACTGTIVAKNGSTGFVLTAAHCLQSAGDPPGYVVLGTDWAASKTFFPVKSYKADPQYDANSSTHDFGMLTITGVGAQTPVIPAMTPAQDNLKVGSTVTFVGYGRTENNDQNTQRFYVQGSLEHVNALTVDYSQANGGPCEGDSGGPSLSTVNGAEVVSTVTSSGDPDCIKYGISGRVAAAYNTFINPYITGGAPGQQTCDECTQSATQGQGACMSEVDACTGDADCSAMLQCFQGCSDDACYQACAQKHPAGLKIYNGIFDCVCTTGCKVECANEAMCNQAPPPKCGFTADASCQSCFEGQCCAEATACSNDAICPTCFSNAPDASCNSNQLAQAFSQCLVDKCAQPCGIQTGGGGGGQGGGSPITPGGGGAAPTGTGTDPGGVGGAGQGGGAATGTGTGNGSGNNKASNDSNDGVVQNSGCSVGGAPSRESPLAALALAALGLAVAARRRR